MYVYIYIYKYMYIHIYIYREIPIIHIRISSNSLTQWCFPPEKSPFSHSALRKDVPLGLFLRHLVRFFWSKNHQTSKTSLRPYRKTGWWFQPIWKILVKLEIFPPRKSFKLQKIPRFPFQKKVIPEVHHPPAAVLNHHVSLATRLQPLVLRPGCKFERNEKTSNGDELNENFQKKGDWNGISPWTIYIFYK